MSKRLYLIDWNIYSMEDRLEAIKEFPLEKLRQSDLELIANYVLFGKEEDGTSVVDRKEIYIKTKHNTWNRDNRTVSLEELRWGNDDENRETAKFDVGAYECPTTVYKKPRMVLNKERAAQVPGMVELWKQIDDLAALIESGKLTQNEMYKAKHELISLRADQYKLYEQYFQTVQKKADCANLWTDVCDSHFQFEVLPRGTVRGFEKDEFFAKPRLERTHNVAIEEKPNVHYFDFRKKEHLQALVVYYEQIAAMIENEPISPLWSLLHTFDAYVEMAHLDEEQIFILEQRKAGKTNVEIAAMLFGEENKHKKTSRVSVHYTGALKKIIAAVEENYDEWLCASYDKAWRTCPCCGKELFLSETNFAIKVASPSGLARTCKRCVNKKESDAKNEGRRATNKHC